uniref:Anoctamin n=1 Tax=Timema cristinae TaxID=61476 RepID=A0A7R9H5B0_TIMCR|nr:unnamed protein product [Timema cristinae]
MGVGQKSKQKYITQNANVVGSFVSSSIYFILIMIAKPLYELIAGKLTDMEYNRTEAQYEGSYTFKLFAFEFVNYYCYPIYISFFKGVLYTHPGDKDVYQKYFGIALDLCDPAGCLSELLIQMFTIMTGKQIINNLVEVVLPLALRWWRQKDVQKVELPRWEADYKLTPYDKVFLMGHHGMNVGKPMLGPGLPPKSMDLVLEGFFNHTKTTYICLHTLAGSPRERSSRAMTSHSTRWSLFYEIQEMVIQYGFVTLFVAAFPIAPLLALINNIFEIRIDANKFLTGMRRPLARNQCCLGAWDYVIQFITYLSVLTNACVIGFTSDFVPRLVYILEYREDQVGYAESSMSVYPVDKLPRFVLEADFETCLYPGSRYPDGHSQEFQHTLDFWQELAAKLAFVVIFENVVLLLTGLLAWAIPDVPTFIKELIIHAHKTSVEVRRKLLEDKRVPSDLTPLRVPSDLTPLRVPSDLAPLRVPSDLIPPEGVE